MRDRSHHRFLPLSLALLAPGLLPGSLFAADMECSSQGACLIVPVVFEQISNKPRPLLSGTAEPSTRLNVGVAGAVFNTFVDEIGNWSVDTATDPVAVGNFSPDNNGFNEVVLLSHSSTGKLLGDTSSNELLIDTQPPAVPVISPLVSNDSTPVLRGSADPKAVSTLAIAGAVYFLQTDTTGSWMLDIGNATPSSGHYLPTTDSAVDILVRTTDEAGNQSVDLSSAELQFQFDSDLDGLADVLEGWSASQSAPARDSDQDGLPDYLDTDSDDDGLPDSIESGTLARLSGLDSDLDNIDDAIDVSFTSGRDDNGDGIDDLAVPPDTDRDGLADFIDPDADNDDIPDRIESHTDSDADGIADYLDTDSDNDGTPDRIEGSFDSDLDALADYVDIDSDNDGIPDHQESGDRDADGLPDRLDLDSDNDGISDRDESTDDADGDGIANYLDLDSDNDEVPDLHESSLSSAMLLLIDVNHDGKVDSQSEAAADTTTLPPSALPAPQQPAEIAAIRAYPRDTDGDGLADHLDLDSDNDGIPDLIEAGGRDRNLDARTDHFIDANADGYNDTRENAIPVLSDTDQDRIVDLRDLDSDNDGIPDLMETYGGPLRRGGAIQAFIDANRDGLDDIVALSLKTPEDTDNDSLYNFLDTDSNGNGLSDLAELGFAGNLSAAPPLAAAAGVNESPARRIPPRPPRALNQPAAAGCSLAAIPAPGGAQRRTSDTDPLFPLLLAACLVLLHRSRSGQQQTDN